MNLTSRFKRLLRRHKKDRTPFRCGDEATRRMGWLGVEAKRARRDPFVMQNYQRKATPVMAIQYNGQNGYGYAPYGYAPYGYAPVAAPVAPVAADTAAK